MKPRDEHDPETLLTAYREEQMANLTNCPRCETCYEESSEEEANRPGRMCKSCYVASKRYQDAITGADPKATAKLIAGLRSSMK